MTEEERKPLVERKAEAEAKTVTVSPDKFEATLKEYEAMGYTCERMAEGVALCRRRESEVRIYSE